MTPSAPDAEDLARQALERKALVQQQLQSLDQQVVGLEQQQEKLVSSEKQLQAKIEAFRSQKEVIKAQYSAAEAQVRIGEAATGIGEQMADTGLAIQRAKEKTEAMQARAGAIEELVESGTLDDFTAGDQTALDRELAQLQASSQVDQELARLKGEIGAGAAERARAVIVRLMGEGQYQVSDDCASVSRRWTRRRWRRSPTRTRASSTPSWTRWRSSCAARASGSRTRTSGRPTR